MQAKAEPEALRQMQERGGTWAAYQNADLSSADVGRLQFLKVGPDCTHKEPPTRMPDTPACGPGWRYPFAGMVDLETGEVIPKT